VRIVLASYLVRGASTTVVMLPNAIGSAGLNPSRSGRRVRVL